MLSLLSDDCYQSNKSNQQPNKHSFFFCFLHFVVVVVVSLSKEFFNLCLHLFDCLKIKLNLHFLYRYILILSSFERREEQLRQQCGKTKESTSKYFDNLFCLFVNVYFRGVIEKFQHVKSLVENHSRNGNGTSC